MNFGGFGVAFAYTQSYNWYLMHIIYFCDMRTENVLHMPILCLINLPPALPKETVGQIYCTYTCIFITGTYSQWYVRVHVTVYAIQ